MPQYKSTILVTGGTTGLGYEAALVIAKAQPDTLVVVASRSDKENAASTINNKLHQSNVIFQQLDLASQSSIRSFAQSWSASNHPPITALVLNAGLQFPSTDPNYTSEGIEVTFGVNHVGHALLFYLLCPHLTSDCRIVLTSSGTHDPAQKTGIPDAEYTTAEELAHPSGKALKAQGLQRYSTSKLCNVLWTYALDRRLKSVQQSNGNKWTVTTMDPGFMPATSLSRSWPAPIPWISQNVLPRLIWLLRWFMGPNVHTVPDSGAALARLAIGDDVHGVSGKYFEGLKERKSSDASYDVGKQEDLWAGTVKLVAKDDAERKKWEGLV